MTKNTEILIWQASTFVLWATAYIDGGGFLPIVGMVASGVAIVFTILRAVEEES